MPKLKVGQFPHSFRRRDVFTFNGKCQSLDMYFNPESPDDHKPVERKVCIFLFILPFLQVKSYAKYLLIYTAGPHQFLLNLGTLGYRI